MGRMSVRARRAGRLRGDHGMHRLLRPLPCLFALAALAGTSHDALAARPKQVQQEKKPPAASPARLERGTAVKKEEKSVKKDDKAAKQDAKPKRTEHAAVKHHKKKHDDELAEKKTELTGDLAAVKNVIDLARKRQDQDATDAAKNDRRSRRAKARRMVHAAPSRVDARFAPLPGVHQQQPELAEQRADAPARGSAAVAGEGGRRDHPRLLWRKTAADRKRPLCAGPVPGLRQATASPPRARRRPPGARKNWANAPKKWHDERVPRPAGARGSIARAWTSGSAPRTGSAAMRAAKRLGDDYVAIVKACAAVKGDADKALGKLNDVPRSGARRSRLCAVPRQMGDEEGQDRRGREDVVAAGARNHGAAGHR